jgi:hypothetical protein
MADTNEPGYRRIAVDQRKWSTQAMDDAGHFEWILQAGGHAEAIQSRVTK